MPTNPTDSLSGRRVLVTGASGFIGAGLCARALEAGATVYAVSRTPREGPGELRWEAADLVDAEAARDLVLRVEPDVVFHLASEVSGGRDLELVLPMLRANLVATVNLMVATAEAGCDRVVLAGSMEEPDWGDEDAVPQSPYAVAKWSALAYARHLHALHELPVAHLRLGMVYGPGQLDLRKFVPYVTVSLLRGVTPQLTSGARGVDWIYVEDVIDAFLQASHAPGLEGRSLQIGSGSLVTTRDVAVRLHALIGGPQPAFGVIPDRALERVLAADPGVAAETMDWRPRTPLDEGLARTVAFYRSNVGHLGPLPGQEKPDESK